MDTEKKENVSTNKVPWKHVLCYTIERALDTYVWLEEQQQIYTKNLSAQTSAALEAGRVRILCDIFSVYVTTLIDGGKNRTYSLKKFRPDIYERFKDLEIIKKCKENRNNRSAHEADSYGHFIDAEEIISSDIKDILMYIRAEISISS